IEEIEHRRSRKIHHRRQRVSKAALRPARSGGENVLRRVGHAIENTALRCGHLTLELSESFQPWFDPARNTFRICRKLCVLRRAKFCPIAKTHRRRTTNFGGFHLSNRTLSAGAFRS